MAYPFYPFSVEGLLTRGEY